MRVTLPDFASLHLGYARAKPLSRRNPSLDEAAPGNEKC